jgi:hypothetical protein
MAAPMRTSHRLIVNQNSQRAGPRPRGLLRKHILGQSLGGSRNESKRCASVLSGVRSSFHVLATTKMFRTAPDNGLQGRCLRLTRSGTNRMLGRLGWAVQDMRALLPSRVRDGRSVPNKRSSESAGVHRTPCGQWLVKWGNL